MRKKKDDVAELIKGAIAKPVSSVGNVVDENSYKVKHSRVKSGGRIVDFDEGYNRRNSGIRENLAEWNNRDFALYMKKKYVNVFKTDWQPNVVNISVNMNAIKQAIYDVVGFCDNITLKEYIDSFFAKWASFYKGKNKGILYINQFKQKDAVVDFASHYDRNEAVKKYQMKTEDITELSTEDMNKSYLLGIDNFVLEYGIVLVCNWLIIRENKDKISAANDVAKAAYRLCQSGLIDAVLKSTEKYSPYPDWMPCKQHDVILSALGKKVKKSFNVEVKYMKGIRVYDFIKEKK